MHDLRSIIEQTTHFRYRLDRSRTRYIGPCPYCGEGDKRFQVYFENHYWCRTCDARGDTIDFLRKHLGMSYFDAVAYLGEEVPEKYKSRHHQNVHKHNNHQEITNQPTRLRVRTEEHHPPAQAWLTVMAPFVEECSRRLFANEARKAHQWLRSRCLSGETLAEVGVGFNPTNRYLNRELLGLPSKLDEKGRSMSLLLPRGVIIPWRCQDELWGIRVRRATGDNKYHWIAGGTLGLYNADAVQPGRPAVLVEGEFDALTITQATAGRVAAVATGSTHGARHVRWLARLALSSTVLVAYDADTAGENAAAWWLDALPNARRWRPYWADVNAMAQDGVNIADWVNVGLHTFGQPEVEGVHEAE